MTNISQKSAILLSAAEPDRQVIVTPEDEDRFGLTCAQAIEACKIHTNSKVWFEELTSLFQYIHDWAQKKTALVHACYATPHAGQVVIFVVPVADSFDVQLSDLLADLNLEICEKFQLIAAEILQIPGKDTAHLGTFLNSKVAKTLYAPGR